MSGRVQQLQDAANMIRLHSVNSTQKAGSGHPTSASSMAEIMSVLFFDQMRYDVKFPLHPASDRLVLSKGHACPGLYGAWVEAGLLSEAQLLSLREIGSDIEGHPTPRLNFIDVATGSLGQGLGAACGMAYTGKYFDKSDFKVYCVMGDSEVAEGSVWEAFAFASHYKLDNLIAIVDVNRLGQSDETMLGHDMEKYKSRCEAFGWDTHVVDGHDVTALCELLAAARRSCNGKPFCVLAKTFKGRNFPGVEDEMNWHGKALGGKAEAVVAHLKSLIKDPKHGLKPLPIEAKVPDVSIANVAYAGLSAYKLGEKVATRAAYGNGLLRLAKSFDRLVVLDSEVKNSTMTLPFRNANPEKFIECFIAEQNMVSVGIGAACRDRCVAFASTFACFLSRAYDQIRMGAISFTNLNLVGSHVGVSIGADGPSQMALEDIAMFRAIQGATVIYPSDAVSCEAAILFCANTKGIGYIRTTRGATPVIYPNEEKFEYGKGKVVRKCESPKAVLIGGGITLNECINAAKELSETKDVEVTVIDPIFIKPFDMCLVRNEVARAGGRVLVVEDHYPEGGLGETVMSALMGLQYEMAHLAVRELPRSGPDSVMLNRYGISQANIVHSVQSFKGI